VAWKGKSRGGLAGYRIFVSILKYYGISSAYFVLRFVAFYFFLTNPKSFSFTYKFYRYRIGLGPFRSVALIYKNYYSFGQVLLDKIAVMAGFSTNFSFNYDGENYLREMVNEKKGGILISAHIGNFEMAGYMLERLDTKVSIIIFDDEYARIKNYLSSISTKNYNVITIKKGETSHIFEINNALREGQIVCIHGDRFLKESKKMKVPFLGKDAYFPTGPFYMSMKFNVPVSFVFAMKENSKGYHFYATQPKVYQQPGLQADRDNVIHTIISDYICEFSTMVKKYPDQWFNYYDFWEQ
jgi:predicted LPLAT superfamily acyltransferase